MVQLVAIITGIENPTSTFFDNATTVSNHRAEANTNYPPIFLSGEN